MTAIIFTPDGKTIISGDRDGALRLWDAPAAWIDRVCEKVLYVTSAGPSGRSMLGASPTWNNVHAYPCRFLNDSMECLEFRLERV